MSLFTGRTEFLWFMNAFFQPCSIPDCLYLHDFGPQEDSFTKDEIVSAFTRYVGSSHETLSVLLCGMFLNVRESSMLLRYKDLV